MLRFSLLLCLILLCASVVLAKTDSVVIADGGLARFSVVVPRGAGEPERFAAQELSRYRYRSGVKTLMASDSFLSCLDSRVSRKGGAHAIAEPAAARSLFVDG